MPKEITHVLIAQEVLERLKESGCPALAQALADNLHAFYLGATIPDALFYDVISIGRASADHSTLCRILHSADTTANDAKAVALFSAIRSRPFRWPLQVAFSAGVVTHTVADRLFHGLIDDYTSRWRLEGALATSTHRHVETLIDIVLAKNLGLSVKAFDLKGMTNPQGPYKNALLNFYLYHLWDTKRPVPAHFVYVLKRAHWQQMFFCRLFQNNFLYHIVTRLNNLTGARLDVWSSLFYAHDIGAASFSILNRLGIPVPSDLQPYSGTAPAILHQTIAQAVSLIRIGSESL
jgi:hypothetical protein